MPLSHAHRNLIRDLAKRVAELAADPVNEEHRRMWYRHNALERVKPMILVFPEGSWTELIPDSELIIDDPEWRRYEFWLRHLIYRAEVLKDDKRHRAILPDKSRLGINELRTHRKDEGERKAWERFRL